MTTSYDTASIAERLSSAGASTVLTPDAPDYRPVLAGFNLALQHTPDAVVVAGSESDVVAAVRTAGEAGVPLTPIGHGHGFTADVTGGVAVTTTGLGRVEVDATTRTATVGAGTAWSAVIEAAAPHGLAPLCGSAPHVGVVGYLLGGGLSPVARTYGFAADHVRSFRVVTGTGELVSASRDENPDLFWALRGGKGGLGVVTEVVIDLFPLPTLQAGGLFFDGADAAAVMHTFAEWSQDLPESVSTSVALLRLPPDPALPEPIRGRFVVHVRVAVVGDAAEAERLVAPLRAVATPLMDVVGEMPFAAMGMVHSDPVDPMPVAEGGALLRAVTAETVDAILAVAGPDVEAPLALVELRLLGGAMAREPQVPNAVGHRDAGYSLFVIGAPVPELLDTVVPAVIGGLFAAVAPWRIAGCTPNFVGRVNTADDVAAAWSPDVRARLHEVRRAYDPQGLFPYDGHGA